MAAKNKELVKKAKEKGAVTPYQEFADSDLGKETSVEKSEVIKEKKSKNKFPIGSIVFISKDADADLNGFKLFPQYKKYTYTVEAYDEKTGVYSLRKLNLLLKLKEDSIVSPSENAGSPLQKVQF